MIKVYVGKNCEGKGLEELLHFTTSKSREFHIHSSPRNKSAALRMLKCYLLRVEYLTEWPGQRFANPDPEGYPILFFKSSPESVKILCEEMISLYQSKDGDAGEDLCFYRKDGRPLLVTITHERLGWLELEEGEFPKVKAILEDNGIAYSLNSRDF